MSSILETSKNKLKTISVKMYNSILASPDDRSSLTFGIKELEDIEKKSKEHIDISDHLMTMFKEALAIKPKFILELGVRFGHSSYVFDKVARLCNSKYVSLDIDDCSDRLDNPDWVFLKEDDIEFAKRFEDFKKEQGIEHDVDLLFIDTSHLYDHTVAEINSYFPLLADKATVIFHDTNIAKVCYKRDGTIYKIVKNPHRGVIGALETYFKTKFDESVEFVDYRDGWLIHHQPFCNGLTILKKVSLNDN